MRSIQLPILLLLISSPLLIDTARAFSPQATPTTTDLRQGRVHQQLQSRLPPLRYRELDTDDDDTTLLKLQNRAPPGFDVKENLSKRRPTTTAMNVPLIRAIFLNQAIIVVAASVVLAAIFFATDGLDGFAHMQEMLHWGGQGSSATNLDFPLTPTRLATGILGAIPMIALGGWVEGSDNRAFANVNFSTIAMVLTLFGRRQSPPPDFLAPRWKDTPMPTTSTLDVAMQSLILAVVTGICEEAVFRMEIPALLNHYFGGYPILPLIGQALLFGLGHAQPRTGWAENSIVVALQASNGLLLGLVYLLSGGDIVSCMVAHAVYDFSVFFKTWLDANQQIEYAEKMCFEDLPSTVQADLDGVLRGIKGAKDPSKLLPVIKRLFYTFDFDKNTTLSKSEVRRGFSYMALERAGTPPPQEQVDTLFDKYTSEEDKSRLSFADFLRLYMSSGAFNSQVQRKG